MLAYFKKKFINYTQHGHKLSFSSPIFELPLTDLPSQNPQNSTTIPAVFLHQIGQI